jgi:hypothetical protein
MRSAQIVPEEGSYWVVVNGKEWSCHDNLKKAEQIRDQILVSEIQRAKKTPAAVSRGCHYSPQAFARTQEKGLAIERE